MRLLLVTLLLTSCASIDTFPPLQKHRDRGDFVARSKSGMISTGHPLASDAGLQMLRKGGNAMDAAAAVSFMISVVRPQSTGIGGGGFMLYYDSSSRLTKVYDFRERAPAKAYQKMYLDRSGNPKGFKYKGQIIPNASVNGHLAVGVPGLVAGIVESHKKYGKLPLKDVIQPAIDVAINGFKVYESLASALKRRQEIMMKFESSRKIFYPTGKAPVVGDTIVQKDLAWTLTQIRDKGHNGFYRGAVANKIVKEMRRGRGLIRHNDLRRYKVKMREPVVGDYRGSRIVSMPPPSSGGAHIVQMLNMLESYDLSKMKPQSVETRHLLAETMRRAFADRAKYLGDTDFVKVPLKGIVSKPYAKSLVSTIDMKKASSSKVIGAGKPFAYESNSTTHFSIVDQWGNAVSSTQTINYSFGSCVVAEGTGIVLNNEMDDFSIKPGVPNAYGLVGSKANAVAARKTMLSSMSPTLVFNKNDDLELVLGSPGGPRIINATFQTIVNYLDFKMSLADAVHAYRIHHQWLPDLIRNEPNGLDRGDRKVLEKMGHQFKEIYAVGNVLAVGRDPEGGWIGVADTRQEGKPYGL